MLDYYPTHNSSTPRYSKDIDLRAREEGQKEAMLDAKYRKALQPDRRRAGIPLRTLLASLFSFL
jgi:hypothetical protein